MLRRIAVVAAVCAATLPLFGGSASASCVDDLLSSENYDKLSDHWHGRHYLHVVDGNVVVESGHLVSDGAAVTLAVVDLATEWKHLGDATRDFVDCTAG